MADTSIQHNAVPGIFGLALGLLFENFNLTFLFDYYPNPMQYALFVSILASPLIAKLTRTELGLDHTLGMSAVSLPMILLWFLGFSYFVVALPALAWIWMSVHWPQLELPPFRIGVWHATGISFTSFIGIVVAYSI